MFLEDFNSLELGPSPDPYSLDELNDCLAHALTSVMKLW